MRLHFNTVYLDQGNGCFIGPKQHNGDFAWYPVIKTADLEDAGGFKDHYLVSVVAVSIEELRRTGAIDSVIASMGREESDVPQDDLSLVWDAAEYGASAPIWETTGNNWRKLLQQAREEARVACMFTGFVLDRETNALGASGWDRIAGDFWPGAHPRDEE